MFLLPDSLARDPSCGREPRLGSEENLHSWGIVLRSEKKSGTQSRREQMNVSNKIQRQSPLKL
jgi:hypothetical protein